MAGSSDATAEDAGFQFGAGDRLQITVFERPELSGRFTVQGSGQLSLPEVGRIQAAGRTADELEEEIEAKLAGIGMVGPQVILEVEEYRPIYVVGDVRAPGRYPFAAGMTVLQAIAVAGGYPVLDDESLRLQMELLRAREQIELLQIEYLSALALKARLLAERDGAPTISFPPEILERRDEPHVAELIDGQTRIFTTRRRAISGEITILEEKKRKLDDEIALLEAQLGTLTRRRELVEGELTDIEGLFEKGLTPKTRLLTLQRIETELESDRLELSAFISRAAQEIGNVDLSIANLRNEHLNEVVVQLADVRASISGLEVRLRSARETQILQGTLSTQPTARLVADDGSLFITRNGRNGPEDIPATEHSRLLPGDTVRVVKFAVEAVPRTIGSITPDGQVAQSRLAEGLPWPAR